MGIETLSVDLVVVGDEKKGSHRQGKEKTVYGYSQYQVQLKDVKDLKRR